MRVVAWLSLLLAVQISFAGNGVASISDVRVSPLLQTRWGQTSDTGSSNSGSPCFNRFTPGNAPCGCSAAAMAQVLRYWQYPANALAGQYACSVGGVKTSLSVSPGAYDWANMPLDTRGGVSETECDAIGKLTCDCALALHTMFGATSSFAFSDAAFSVLTGTFGYANAIGYCPVVDGGIPFDAIKEAMFASLDAGSPVMASLVTADNVGHQVLIDGYGFDGKTPYVHVLFGWPARSEACDGWYVLPNVTPYDAYFFTRVDGIVYNIFPDVSGDVLSGRVLDEAGAPIVGAVVSAVKKSAKSGVTTTTDANGVYAFVLTGGATYAVACGNASKNVKLAKSESAACSWNDPLMPAFSSGGVCGNSWGNDLVVSQKADPVPPEEDPEEEDDPLGAFNPAKAVNGVYPFCGVVRNADGSVGGTITLKIGKASKKGVSSVSGAIATLDGKKYSLKSYKAQVDEKAPCAFKTTAGKLGDVELRIGSAGFEARVTCKDGRVLTGVPSDLAQGFAKPSDLAFALLDALPAEIDGAPVLAVCTPNGEPVSITAAGKLAKMRKAASPKVKKISYKDENGKKQYRYELQGLDDPQKPNLSGLKLTYTAKSGTFKGSFYVYCDLGMKLKKYTFKVNGLVVDGEGVGLAVCSKPSMSFGISIK